MEWEERIYINEQVQKALKELKGATAHAIAGKARVTRATAEKHLERLVRIKAAEKIKVATGKKNGGYIWAYVWRWRDNGMEEI